jgi:hypothetical protein
MWLEASKSAGIQAHVENAMPSVAYAPLEDACNLPCRDLGARRKL